MNAAIARGGRVIYLFILEEDKELRSYGGAKAWWLDKSLRALGADIMARGGRLILRRGAPAKVLDEVVQETGADAVFWNRRYGGTERAIDTAIKTELSESGLHIETFNGSLLTEPWTVKTGSGSFYRVFTPYWKAMRNQYSPPAPAPAPDQLPAGQPIETEALDSWGLHPQKPDWSVGLMKEWTPGEAGARRRLDTFLSDGLATYDVDRNRPDLENGTSRLSAHLAVGEIAPSTIWTAVQHQISTGRVKETAAMVFLSEIVWRDFAHVLLFHQPDLASRNYNRDFDLMPWRSDNPDLRAWQTGQTGYPIVDAGMRQLWQTGWMHNRVRMIVASFLTKHLLLPWQLGEKWFWDTLVDADPASNSASWQWTAGSGADAAPYFRVFNPIIQGNKFDQTGNYVRRWCPELSKLPRKFLYAPWEADSAIMAQAGIRLGETYPAPIIDHKSGRQRALDAYATLKQRRDAA